MSRRGNARQWKKKSVKQFPGLSAQKFPTDNVAASLSKSVLISPSSNVSRCVWIRIPKSFSLIFISLLLVARILFLGA